MVTTGGGGGLVVMGGGVGRDFLEKEQCSQAARIGWNGNGVPSTSEGLLESLEFGGRPLVPSQ